MPVDAPSMFSQVIQDHLDLKRRNAAIEPQLPIDRYKSDDPFENHPLFKTEEQARLEETMDGEIAAPVVASAPPAEAAPLAWPGEETVESVLPAPAVEEDSGIWSKTRDFDWGD
jgi:hypothetical protein